MLRRGLTFIAGALLLWFVAQRLILALAGFGMCTTRGKFSSTVRRTVNQLYEVLRLSGSPLRQKECGGAQNLLF
jgi:hypothetical protein